MNNQMKNKKLEDGLPDIAGTLRRRRIGFIILAGLLYGVLITFHFYHQTPSAETKMIDETYTLNESAGRPITPIQSNAGLQTEIKSKTQPLTSEQIALIQAKEKELQQRLSSPLMMVNNSTAQIAQTSDENSQAKPDDANTKFLMQASSQRTETVTADQLTGLGSLIVQGSLIHATLEPAINSDLPGSLRAVVSEPVFSEDGTRELVPMGSRLLGEYKSDEAQGAARIFVVWTRLVTPSGISIQLGSPGVDNLGISGLSADQIDRHFWAKFGTASLLSLIDAGVSNTGSNGSESADLSGGTSYRQGIANSFGQSADQSLEQEGMIPPTLKLNQGKSIIVFVAKDLRFPDTQQTRPASFNVF